MNRPKAWKYARRTIAVLVGAPVALTILALLLLQTPAFATRAVNSVAARLALWPDATLTAGRARLRGFGGITLSDVRLTGRDGTSMATVDTVVADLRPFALMRGNLIILAARVVGADVTLRQQRDSSWDVIAPFTKPDTTKAIEVRVDVASITRSRVEARFLASKDSVLRIEGIEGRIADLRAPTALRVRIDTLGARIYPPLRPKTPALLSAHFGIDNGVLTAQRVLLTSDSSNVTIAGTLLLPGGDAKSVHNLDFHIGAAPLDFRDISALVPGFDVPGSLRLDGRVTGSAQLIAFDVHGTSFDGATFKATGELTPGRDSVRYVVDAEVRKLNPTLWSRNAPATKRVDIDAKIALAGPTRDSLAGTIHVATGRAELRTFTVLPTTVDATFASGVARFTLAGGVSPWAHVDATGTMRPLDAQPSYDINANVRQLSDTTFGSVRVANGRAQVHATGKGIKKDSTNGRATVTASATINHSAIHDARITGAWENSRANAAVVIANAVIGALAIDTATANLHLDSGALGVNATAVASAGHMSVDGHTRPFDSLPVWSVEHMSVTGLDLARVIDSLPSSHINATLHGEGHGFAPNTMQASATVFVANSTIGTESVDTATFATTLQDGLLAVKGDGRSRRGSATVVGNAHPFADTITFHVDALRFRDVVLDTSMLGGHAVLSGTAKGDGALLTNAWPRLSGSVDLDPTKFNRGRVSTGHITFSLDDSLACADAKITTGKGTIDATATAHIARNARGVMYVSAGHADGKVRLPDLDALLDADSAGALLNATFTVDASGTDSIRTMSWTANVSADGAYAGARVDTMQFRARVAAGILRLDTLLIRSNIATGDGSGTLAIAKDATPPDSARLHVRLVADTVYTADHFFSAHHTSLRNGSLVIDARNANGGIDATADFAVHGLISPGPWADSAKAHGVARFVDGHITELKATFAGAELGYGATEIATLSGNVTHDAGNSKFDVSLAHDKGHSMHIVGSAIPSKHSVTLASMDVAIATRTWTLGTPAIVMYGPRTTIDHFVLADGFRRVSINGVIDRNGTQDFTVKLDSVPLQGFAEFAGFEGVDGSLDGAVHLTGPATRVGVESKMNLRLLGTRGTIVLNTRDTLGNAQPTLSAHLADSSGRRLDIDGTVPVRFSLASADTSYITGEGALALRIAADSFSVGWMTPVLHPYGISQIDGKLRADVHITGTFNDPTLAGSAAIAAGRIKYPRHGIDYRDVHGDFTLEGNHARVAALHVSSGGSATFNGDVVFETAGSAKLDLHADFDRFRAANNEWVKLGISGTATITGNAMSPQVKGDLRLIDTDIYADAAGTAGGGKPVALTKDDFRMLEFYFGYQPTRPELVEDPLIPWGMDIKVALGTNTWLRRKTQPQLAIQLDGSLDVRKTPGDSIQLFGTIEALPTRSYFEDFGRRFQVASGTVTFNGPMMAWIADFQARYTVPSSNDPGSPEVVITLGVKGSIDSLAVTLGGEPAMETADVLSYLATGRPATSSAAFGGNELGTLGTSFAAGQIAGIIEDAAGKSVGLDVIEVRQNGLKGATVVAGRYVSPRLFVGFEQPLGLQQSQERQSGTTVRTTEVQLEYTAYKWLLATLQGGQSNIRFFFRVRRAF